MVDCGISWGLSVGLTLPGTASDRTTVPGFCLHMCHVSFGGIGKQIYTILIHTVKLLPVHAFRFTVL